MTRWRLDGRSGYYGYIDPYFIAKGECSTKTDVFAYGVVLLGLITKRVFNAGKEKESDFVNKWAEQEYDRNLKQGIRTPSLVDTSLKTHQHFDSGDGRWIAQLAMRCVKYYPDQRHEMDDVVRMLQRLKVVRNYVDENDLCKKFERSWFQLDRSFTCKSKFWNSKVVRKKVVWANFSFVAPTEKDRWSYCSLEKTNRQLSCAPPPSSI